MTTSRAHSEATADPDRAGQRGWILLALMCSMMLAAMDTNIVATAIPQIVADLGGFSLFSWVFSIYLLAQTVSIPVYGKLADIFGRKMILQVGTVIFLAGSTASALAWNMPSLVVFRGLQGLGAGAVMATVATLAGDLYSVRERASVQGWLSSVWGMAAIIGPVLGGAFAEYATWRWIFLVNLPIGIVAMFLLGIFLHETFDRQRHAIDYTGAALILLTGGLLIFGLLEGGQSWPWWSAPSIGIFLAVIVLAGMLVWVERRAAEPIMPGWLWSRRVLSGANLATVAMGIVMMAPSTYLPTYAQSVLGLGAIGAGLTLASMSIGWPVASSLSGRMYMRVGFRQTALWGALLIVVAVAGFAFYPPPLSAWGTVVDVVLLGAGFGLLSTPLLVGVQSVVGWDRRGVVTGANMFSRYLGASLGAALMGAIFNATLRGWLERAPDALHGELPGGINQVITVLQQGSIPPTARAYLRDAINMATVHLYLAGLVVAGLTVLAVLVIPRRFHEEAP